MYVNDHPVIWHLKGHQEYSLIVLTNAHNGSQSVADEGKHFLRANLNKIRN